jgi:molybdopterin converting factor small subunit
MPRVFLINNDGGGFADYVNTSDGTTIDQFFASQMQGQRPDGYMIRVNRDQVQASYELKEDDRVSITPTKVEGAKN